MGWFAFVDSYCERLDAGLLAEPVNLVSNGAFLVMACWLWPRTQPGSGTRRLAAIGLGLAFSQRCATLGGGCGCNAHFAVCAILYLLGQPAVLAIIMVFFLSRCRFVFSICSRSAVGF